MAYILDGVVILIFLIAISVGYRRGFIKTVAGMVALLAALAVAMLLGQPVAEFVYDKTVEPTVIAAVEEQVAGDGATIGSMNRVLDSLPGFVQNVMGNVGITTGEDVLTKLTGQTTDTLAEQVSANVVRPVVVPLLRVLCILVLFLLAYIGASLLFKVLNVVAKLPLLKQLNKSLGLISGVVSGVLWVLLVVTVIQVLAATNTLITQQELNDSLLTNWLVGLNPLGSVLHEALSIIN